jgi:nudix motif 8
MSALPFIKFDHKWISKIKLLTTTEILITELSKQPLDFKPSVRRAAVLIPLCNRNGEASILFNVRSKNVSTHKGQVSFPGGHLNPGETAIDAAVRETYEELGDSIGKIHILGSCQTVPAITGTMVTPILGFIEKDVQDFSHLTPSKDEVHSVFSRTIGELLDPSQKRYETLSRNGTSIRMPSFGVDDDERIWGLTAYVLDAVLRRVVLPTMEHQPKPAGEMP